MRFPLSPDGGKGHQPRDTDKKKFDENYIRAFGKECPVCAGIGFDQDINGTCEYCNGIGKIEK